MPFKSEKQRRWMHMYRPDLARLFEEHSGQKKKPKTSGQKKRRSSQSKGPKARASSRIE